METSEAPNHSVDHKPQILALTSSKGGVGKTHLAVGISAAMAKRKVRVLLIDADLGNGIISDRLGFYPKFNLSHFLLKEKALRDIIEETPFGFFLIGGDRGNFALANLNYPQKMKFLRGFIDVSRKFDFVVFDLASGINRHTIDFALLAEKTIVVTSPSNLISAYGSVRACLSRFMQLELGLYKRIQGYRARRFFRPLILMNNVTDFDQGKRAFEALEGAVENRLNGTVDPFGIKMHYLGAVFHDPGLFKKTEEKRCPVPVASAYSKVAFCVDSMASTLCSSSPISGFDEETRLRYTVQVLMEQQERLRRGLTQKVIRVSSLKIPFRHRSQSISH
jgi:flagellar biosynthesis protein FlhG